MDILKFFGLKEDPFKLTPDPGYFFSSECHKEALQSLDYVIEQREGFCLITGEPGTGKTTLIKIFMEKWKDKAEMALILTPRLSPEEFIISVLDDFGVTYEDKSKPEILKVFRNFLLERSHQKIPVIIIVDEAQSLPEETIEELRLLSNLETEKEKLLQILLIGQPELDERLNQGSLRQLKQRITVSMTLNPLDSGEMLEYINYRLIKAGKGFLKLDKGLKKPIFAYSQGIPRKINLVSSRAIMSAFLEESSIITSKHVKHAIEHLKNGSSASGIRLSPGLSYGIAVGLVIIIITAAGFYYLPGSGIFAGSGTSSSGSDKVISSPAVVAGDDTVRTARVEARATASPSLPEEPAVVPEVRHDNIKKEMTIKPETLYRQGLQVFLTGRFDDALSNFQDFLKSYPQHNLSEDVLYWSGEAYYAMGEYKSAISEFDRVVRDYSGRKTPDALLMASSAFVKLDNKEKAEEVLNWLIGEYPDSETSAKAEERLRELRLFP